MLCVKIWTTIYQGAIAMDPVPIRSRIPEHLESLGRDRQWLQAKMNLSKTQLSDYENLRYMLGIVKAKKMARILKLKCIDDLYIWEWREE